MARPGSKYQNNNTPLLDKTGNINRSTSAFKALVQKVDVTADEIDGDIYEIRKERRCRVCYADPDITQLVDRMLVELYSYPQIIKAITPLLDVRAIPPERRIVYNSIRNHHKNHLSFDKAALRDLAEGNATTPILTGQKNLLNPVTMYQLISNKTWQGLVDGTLSPTVKEGMEAMKLIDQLQKEANGETSVQEMRTQVIVILEAVRTNVSPDVWQRIVRDIRKHQNADAITFPSPQPQIES